MVKNENRKDKVLECFSRLTTQSKEGQVGWGGERTFRPAGKSKKIELSEERGGEENLG